MNLTKYRPYLSLSLITLLISLGFWLTFYLNLPGKIGFPPTTLETLYANYDGPNYMAISKCGYVKNCISTQFSLPQPLEYYPAHFPGYPAIIKYFSLYMSTPKAMLFSGLLGSLLFTLACYQLFVSYFPQKFAYQLALFSLFLPPRLLVLRIIGAPETWFISFTLFSILAFQKKKYFISALLAALSLSLKSPGVILFAAYLCMAIFDWVKKHEITEIVPKYFYYFLGPLVAVLIFYLYFLQTGDFLAYFHSGDNIHLNLLPYLVFISNHTWINTIWLEDVLYIFLVAFAGIKSLFARFRFNLIFVYPFLFTLATVFVAHRDISRYIAPVYPFLFLGFSRFFESKGNRWLLWLLLPAVVLYAINFMIGNVAPIADWTPYL